MVPPAKPEPVQLMPTKVPNAQKAAYDAAWESAFASLLEFHRRHGHFQVPNDAEHPHLHYWTAHQRVRLSKGTMSPERQKRLQVAGFPDEAHLLQRRKGGRIWDRHFKKLMDFRRAHGHFDVPGTDANYKALKEWVNTQRRKHNSGRLLPDRERCLEAFGFPWSASKLKWETRFAELAARKKNFGHCHIPAGWPENPALARWMNILRHGRKNGTLSKEWIARLDQLGFDWGPPRATGGHDAKWEARFTELAAYHQRFGHCRVPMFWPENPGLARWVSSQRVRRKSDKLSPERLAQLDALGFLWKLVGCSDEKWDARFAELAAYHQRFGHCSVPNDWPENPVLARWVQLQRISRRIGRLKPGRLARLETLGFDWEAQCATVENDAKWEIRFAELAAYHRRFGHCQVPAQWPENPELACWVRAQRSRAQWGNLTAERRARLDALGFLWKLVRCSDETWNARFAELAAFQKRFGHCLVPKHWPENPELADWVNRERMRFSHTRQRQPERIDRLDAIQFVWAGGWSTLGRCWRKKRLAFMNGMIRKTRQPGGV